MTRINTFASVTRVSATASGNGILLKSTEYGSNEFVSVKVVDEGGQAGSIYNLSATNENGVDSHDGDDLPLGDLGTAQKVVDAFVTQVSSLRGRLGAFQKNIVGETVRLLGIAFENTSEAESAIRDTDFVAQTAEVARSQILVQAGRNVLAISNDRRFF